MSAITQAGNADNKPLFHSASTAPLSILTVSAAVKKIVFFHNKSNLFKGILIKDWAIYKE